MQRITIEVPKELHAHIKAACAERGESIPMALTRTLRAIWLGQHWHSGDWLIGAAGRRNLTQGCFGSDRR